MNDRNAGFLGIGACIIFCAAVFIFGALRPAYSHFVNAISELGAHGTPNASLWNLMGFIVPGLLFAVAGGAIAGSVGSKQSRKPIFARWLLIISGLAVAGQGIIPARMANGAVIITSWYTRGHLIMSFICGIAWVVAALMLIVPMKRTPDWQGWHILSITLVLLAVLGAFTLNRILPGGLVQRIIDSFYLGWFFLMSLRLVQISRTVE